MNKWVQVFDIELLEIIRNQGVGELQVGAPEDRMLAILGEPELPVVRLSKKSPIFQRNYENMTILTENEYVIAIDINFENDQLEGIILGEAGQYRISEWMDFAQQHGWTVTKIVDVVQLGKDRVMISLSLEGKIMMVSLR
ncbi:hypothetical protein D3C77_467000 [compost metagenome]